MVCLSPSLAVLESPLPVQTSLSPLSIPTVSRPRLHRKFPFISPAGLPLSPPSAPLAYTTSPPLLSRRPSSISIVSPLAYTTSPPLLSRRSSSVSIVSPPRLHHEFPSSLPQTFLHLHRQPPPSSVSRESPPSGGSPSAEASTPPFPPFLPLRNILSINHLERAKTLLPRAHSRSR